MHTTIHTHTYSPTHTQIPTHMRIKAHTLIYEMEARYNILGTKCIFIYMHILSILNDFILYM